MNICKVNHSNQEFGCGAGKSKLNLYNGKLGFEFPLISLGVSNFKIGSLLIYNSQYKNSDFNGKVIGFGNGWKLNIQQYVFPYLSSYNIDGFEEGNYVYIDANWNVHKFVKYKSSSTYGDSRNAYYDADGTGLKLLIGSNAVTQIFDQQNNIYLFDDEGRLVETISGVNVGITKKIDYLNGKITSIYDQRKPLRKIQFMYNSDETLKKVYTSVNNIGFNFDYNNSKLVKIIKYCSNESKDVMEFIYDSQNRMEYAVSCPDLTALQFSYTFFNGENAVKKVNFGAMKKSLITDDVETELYVGEDAYLGEGYYVNEKSKRYMGYTLSMPTKYIKEETNIIYNEYYTQVKNYKGISINYYFNTDGTVISSLEDMEGNLFTLTRSKGWALSTNGSSNLKLNGQVANILDFNNQYTYTANDSLLENFIAIFKDLNGDNKRDEAFSEHFNVTFWINFKNNNQSNLKAELELGYNTNDDDKKTSSVRIERTNTDVWQHVVIPINLGLNQLSLSSIKIKFDGCATETQIHIVDLRISKGGTPEIYINNGTGEKYKEVALKMGENFYYYSNGQVNNKIISPEFYMTENDIFSTYKSLFYSKQNNENYYDLVYNNGTKIESVLYAGINADGKNINFSIEDNDIPNYYFKLVDIIDDGTWSIMEKQMCFHYDSSISKYYYEIKNMVGTLDNIDEISKRLSDASSNITYSWENADGTFRAKKDTKKVITENFYDSFGNTTSIEIFKEGCRDLESIKIEYIYDTEDANLRENPISCKQNGITINYTYDNIENILINSKVGNCKTIYEYDDFNENINNLKIIDLQNQLNNQTNQINYSSKGIIKHVNSKDNIIYGFGYNIFNELESIYRNKSLIIEKKYEKIDKGEVEIKKVYQKENVPSTTKIIYDKQGNILEFINEEDKAVFYYEEKDLNCSSLLKRLSKIEDGFSGEVYKILYDDNNDVTSQKIIIDDKLYIKKYSDESFEYQINDEEIINIQTLKNNSLANEKESVVCSYKISENAENKLHEDFSFSYEYDACGRLSKKNGTISIYNECHECEATGGSACKQVDGVQVDKRISYHQGTEAPKRFTYDIISKGIHTSDEIVSFYYENSNYQNGNVIEVVEGGTRFNENPKNVDLRTKSSLPVRNYKYNYDSYNRLIKEENPIFGNYDYSYCENSGMLKKVINNGDTIKEFFYNAGLLTKISNNGTIKQIKYDNYGNMLNNYNSSFTYNSRNLMDTYSRSEGEVDIVNVKCNYYYNYRGIRYKKEKVVDLNGRFPQYTYINYYLNGNTILGEDWSDSDGNITKKLRYFYDAEGVCGIRYDGYNFSLVKDSLGNISKIMYKGKVIGEYLYDAWGNCVVNEISIANERDSFVLHNNPFRYKGYYCDLESGLYYCNTRYYDSTLCVWLTPDSVEYIDPEAVNGLNLYCYCAQNPVMHMDPNGCAWWHWLIAAAVVVALAIAVVYTAGGALAAYGAIMAAMYGVASSSMVVTVLSYAFVGASLAFAGAVFTALSNSSSISDFMDEGDWGTVISVSGGGIFGAFGGYCSWNEQMKGLDHTWDTERRRFWKAESKNPNSQFYGDVRASQGLTPKGYVLHHPYGRYGSKIGIYTPMTTEQHRAIHKMYGYGNGKGGFSQYYQFTDWWWFIRRL